MALFNQPTDLPVDQVKAMRNKGFDNNQIVQALQRNGYSSTQIFDALNQADLVSGAPAQPEVNAPIEQAGEQSAQAIPPNTLNTPPPPEMGININPNEIEDLVESIIEEKWTELSKNINDVVEWKNEIIIKISKIEQKFDSLKEEFDKLHQAVIGKVGEYDKNILNVGAEVRAMEKVFSKVLPLFTENVNELSRITDSMKKK